MAHPAEQLPKNTYAISTSAITAVGPKNADHFFAITCTAGGVVSVKGGGVYEYVNVDTLSEANVKKYINPDTGVAYTGVTDADGDPTGFYQKIGSEEVSITMVAGQTIYGRFTTVKSDGTFTGFAYAG